MKTHEGKLDRTLRIVAGLSLIAMAATDVVGAWGCIGLVPLLTGAMGNCPLHSLPGIDSCGLRS